MFRSFRKIFCREKLSTIRRSDQHRIWMQRLINVHSVQAYAADKTSSWHHLLYETDSHISVISELKQKLQVALRSKRSHEKGDLVPYLMAQDLVKFYKSLKSSNEKAKFFSQVSEKLGVNDDDVMKLYQTALQSGEKMSSRNHFNLMKSLTPAYQHLFDDVSKLQHGVNFLVNMRKDLLSLYRGKNLTKTPAVLAFDTFLKEHLALWFANGFLHLHCIKWNESSGQLLEKVMQYEAVHPVSSWEDLKMRSGNGRRIFTFSHRLMPGEPLVILHTLLGDHVPQNIQDVLATKNEYENVGKITTATFYSISSTQRGLDGIGLGNLLIKRVVEELKKEFHNMTTYVTLSPVPGFRKWLEFQFKCLDTTDEVPTLLNGIDCDLQQVKKIIKTDNWHESKDFHDAVRLPLIQLCSRYLLNEKKRNFAIDPVAHFHLRNGASLWRINYFGNHSDRGFLSSYGLMVNYKYDLSLIEENNLQYVMHGKIAYSEQVRSIHDDVMHVIDS